MDLIHKDLVDRTIKFFYNVYKELGHGFQEKSISCISTREELTRKIGKDVYKQVVNKNDYSEMNIIFRNKIGTIINFKTGFDYRFSNR